MSQSNRTPKPSSGRADGGGMTGSGEESKQPVDLDWLRRTIDLPVVLLTILSAVLAVVGIYRAAGDGPGDLSFTLSLGFIGACLPTAWAVLRGLWNPDPVVPANMNALLRTLVVPFLTVWVPTLCATVTVLLPPVNHLIESERRPNGWHYTFATEDGAPWFVALVMFGLIALLFAMLGGLMLAVFVVLPVLAFIRPKEAAAGNQLDTSDEAMKSNTLGSKVIAVLVMLAFAVPGFIVFGAEYGQSSSVGEAFSNSLKFFSDPAYYWGDLMRVVGILLIPVGVVALVVAKMVQKPNHAARAATGTAAFSDRHKR